MIRIMNSDFTSKLEHIIGQLKIEVSSLRTGRASPALVEDLEIDYYGTKTPLKRAPQRRSHSLQGESTYSPFI